LFGKQTASDELSALKFGFPSMVQLPGGDVLALFWCVEECLHVIRWIRLAITKPRDGRPWASAGDTP
jgi:hypothetical protein